jgi:hypothetical protein
MVADVAIPGTRNNYIDGCCEECDIDVCEDCLASGRSIEDMIRQEQQQQRIQQQPPRQVCCMGIRTTNRRYVGTSLDSSGVASAPASSGGPQRYNHRRPNYRITGRVNFEDYPDPTSYG